MLLPIEISELLIQKQSFTKNVYAKDYILLENYSSEFSSPLGDKRQADRIKAVTAFSEEYSPSQSAEMLLFYEKTSIAIANTGSFAPIFS